MVYILMYVSHIGEYICIYICICTHILMYVYTPVAHDIVFISIVLTLPPTKYRNPKIDKELIVTLISVTICSLIFFICKAAQDLWSSVFNRINKTCGVKLRCQYTQGDDLV